MVSPSMWPPTGTQNCDRSLCTKRSWHHYVSVDHQLFLPMLSVKLNFDKACIMKNVSEKGSTKASASEQIECNRGKCVHPETLPRPTQGPRLGATGNSVLLHSQMPTIKILQSES